MLRVLVAAFLQRKMQAKNTNVLLGLLVLCGAMGSIPYFSRVNNPSLSAKEKLTGSQRQRGMNLMSGSHDAGLDPNYDHSTGTYTYKAQRLPAQKQTKAIGDKDEDQR